MLSGLKRWIRRILANPFILYLLAIIFLLLVFNHYLIAKPVGLSPDELSAKNASLSISAIITHPLNAPQHLVSYGLHAAGLNWRSAVRLRSTIFAVLFLALFYLVIRPLFGTAIGWMGLGLLLATPLYLIAAKDGSAAVMYFSTIGLLAIYGFANRSLGRTGLILLCFATALAVYTPGLLVWVIAAAVICRKKITAILDENEPPVVAVSILIGILLLAPLGLAIAKDLGLVKQLLLVPAHLPSLVRVLKNILWMGYSLFIKAPHNSPLMIDKLPIFNLIANVLLIFGGFAMWGAARLKLTILLATIFYGVIVAGLNDNLTPLALGIPAALIIMCAGLRYLFIEWRRVFPRNPLAKSLALALMWILVFVQLAFGIRYALIAWPVTADTKTAYVLK